MDQATPSSLPSPPPNADGSFDLKFIDKITREIAPTIKRYGAIAEQPTVSVRAGETMTESIRHHLDSEFDGLKPEVCALDQSKPISRNSIAHSYRLESARERKRPQETARDRKRPQETARDRKRPQETARDRKKTARRPQEDRKGLQRAAKGWQRDTGAVIIATGRQELAHLHFPSVTNLMHLSFLFQGRNLFEPETM